MYTCLLYTSSATQGTFENPTWVSTPELDERLDTAVTILDTDERNAAAMELQDYVMAELCASAPVADMANPYAYQSTYIDWPVADYYNETGELKYYCLLYTSGGTGIQLAGIFQIRGKRDDYQGLELCLCSGACNRSDVLGGQSDRGRDQCYGGPEDPTGRCKVETL